VGGEINRTGGGIGSHSSQRNFYINLQELVVKKKNETWGRGIVPELERRNKET